MLVFSDNDTDMLTVVMKLVDEISRRNELEEYMIVDLFEMLKYHARFEITEDDGEYYIEGIRIRGIR